MINLSLENFAMSFLESFSSLAIRKTLNTLEIYFSYLIMINLSLENFAMSFLESFSSLAIRKTLNTLEIYFSYLIMIKLSLENFAYDVLNNCAAMAHAKFCNYIVAMNAITVKRILHQTILQEAPKGYSSKRLARFRDVSRYLNRG